MKSEGKPIEAIWPEAFDTGKACWLRGKTTRAGEFTKAWFQCVDGRTFPLTETQLLEYRPDVSIHKNFQLSTEDDI